MPRRKNRFVRLAPVLVAAIVAAPSSLLAATPTTCALTSADRTWLGRAVDGWEWTSRSLLKLETRALPWTIVFDGRCTWHLNPGRSDSLRLTSSTPLRSVTFRGATVRATAVLHEGQVRLPDGQRIPARVTSFAGSIPGSGDPFLVIALPSVWRTIPKHAANGDLDALVLAVFMHEAAHTRQAATADRVIARVSAHNALPEELNDDVVQHRFGTKPGYREAYERETALLWRAAMASDAVTRRALAREAVQAMSDRRARFFTGADSMYVPLEDLFLTMEGVGNWTALGYMRAPRGLALSPDMALRRIRGDGHAWTQEEGLALFLVVDALVPGWQQRVLRDDGESGFDLLRGAVER